MVAIAGIEQLVGGRLVLAITITAAICLAIPVGRWYQELMARAVISERPALWDRDVDL
jgi:hypothetical protein